MSGILEAYLLLLTGKKKKTNKQTNKPEAILETDTL